MARPTAQFAAATIGIRSATATAAPSPTKLGFRNFRQRIFRTDVSPHLSVNHRCLFPFIHQNMKMKSQNPLLLHINSAFHTPHREFLESLDDRSFFGAPSNNSAVVPTSHLPTTSMSADHSSQQQHPQPVGIPGPLTHSGYPAPGAGPQPPPVGPHHQPHTIPEDNDHPMGADSALYTLQNSVSRTEQFFMTAADQATGTRDERLAKVIRAKYEAGLLKPYNYVKGYKRLGSWMEKK